MLRRILIQAAVWLGLFAIMRGFVLTDWQQAAFWASVIQFFTLALVWVATRLIVGRGQHFFQQLTVAEKRSIAWEGLDLATVEGRAKLNRMFEHYGITGDANIRAGVVSEPLPPAKLTPLAVRLRNAATFMRRTKFVGADLYCVIHNPQGGQQFSLIDLTSMEIEQAAGVLERTAEDYRRSRALYKGMTDEEIAAMARTVIRGSLHSEAVLAALNGMLIHQSSHTPEEAERVLTRIAAITIEFIYKVKATTL